MSRKRVVITGMGVLTPLSDTVDDFFQKQVEGKSGIGRISAFEAGGFPTQIAGQVRDFDLGRYVADAARYRPAGLNTQFALAAGQSALRDAGLLDGGKADRTRFGVYLGAGEGKQDFYNLIPLIARTSSQDCVMANGRFAQ